MKYPLSSMRAIQALLFMLSISMRGNQAPAKIPSLETLAATPLATPLAKKALSYIASMPATAEQNTASANFADKMEAAFKALNIPEPLYSYVAYAAIYELSQQPTTSPIMLRSAIMELLPFVYSHTVYPQEKINSLLRTVKYLSMLPYDTSVAPWYMDFMQQLSARITNPQETFKETLLIMMFDDNKWSRTDKLNFMLTLLALIEANEQQAAQPLEKRKRKRTESMPAVLGSSSKEILQSLIGAIKDDISGNQTFNASSQLVFQQNDFSYPIFAAVIAQDTLALDMLIKLGVDINITNASGANALTFAVENDLPAMVEYLLQKNASVTNAYTDESGEVQLTYDALETAVEQNNAKVVKLLLTQANYQIDDDMLTNALEKAQEASASNAIQQLLQQEMARRGHTQQAAQ